MIHKEEKKEAFHKPPFFISYLITDPDIFGNTAEQLEKSLTKTFQHYHIDIVCFRDKTSTNKEELALTCLKVSRSFGINTILINSDLKLCKNYKFDGVHLNSQQFDILAQIQNTDIYKIISCHNEDEIKLAQKYGADAVTYSPIFFKENKGEPKGIENLTKIVKRYQNDSFFIIALGGIIDENNINKVQETSVKGFASIRYFKV